MQGGFEWRTFPGVKKPAPHVRPDQTVIDFATACFVEDIPIGHALERAGVAWSTWTRAKKRGQRPHRATMTKLHDALAELVRERDAKRA